MTNEMHSMTIRELSVAALVALAAMTPTMTASAEPAQHAPFTRTLSNTTPLVFGMTADDAAAALGVPLTYISGKPGNELLAAERPSVVNFCSCSSARGASPAGRATGNGTGCGSEDVKRKSLIR